MKKLILVAVALLCVTTVSVQAKEKKGGKKELTPEQKQLVDKYDTNKDGKLDKGEKDAMTAEDKEAYAKAFPSSKGKKKDGDAAAPADQ